MSGYLCLVQSQVSRSIDKSYSVKIVLQYPKNMIEHVIKKKQVVSLLFVSPVNCNSHWVQCQDAEDIELQGNRPVHELPTLGKQPVGSRAAFVFLWFLVLESWGGQNSQGITPSYLHHYELQIIHLIAFVMFWQELQESLLWECTESLVQAPLLGSSSEVYSQKVPRPNLVGGCQIDHSACGEAIIKTCGSTVPLKAVPKLLDIGKEQGKIAGVTFHPMLLHTLSKQQWTILTIRHLEYLKVTVRSYFRVLHVMFHLCDVHRPRMRVDVLLAQELLSSWGGWDLNVQLGFMGITMVIKGATLG